MNSYIIDTIALVRYLEDHLPKKADTIFKQAEQNKCKLLLPDIVIGEFIYISLKGRIRLNEPLNTIKEILQYIKITNFIEQISMNYDAWELFIDIDVLELHDRMICALGLLHDSPIITDDNNIKAVTKTIWK